MMLRQKCLSASRRSGLVALVGLVGLATTVALLAGPTRAQETVGMALAIEGNGVSCEAATCYVPLDGDFTVAIQTDGPPAAGYIAVQTNLFYGGLVYNVTESLDDENVWPDNRLPVRFPAEPSAEGRSVAHGGLTSVTSPFIISTFEGDLVRLSMTCSSEEETFLVALLAYDKVANPLGSTYSLEDQTTVPVEVQSVMSLDPNDQGEVQELPVGDVIDVSCGGSPPTATPTAVPVVLPPTGSAGHSEARADWYGTVLAVTAVSALALGGAAWYARRRAAPTQQRPSK